MFNLDLIEEDWKNNSFRLSEEDVIEIYRMEGVVLSKFKEEWDEYKRKIGNSSKHLSIEEKLLQSIYGKNLKEEEPKNEAISKISKPQRKYLSKESQKKVIEGSLYLVFEETREWYEFLEGKLQVERIYSICLESLINSVKYMIHCEKPVFCFYILKGIERNMTKYIAKYLHVTYREAYEMIHPTYEFGSRSFAKEFDENLRFLFSCEEKEESEKPSKIYERLKNDYHEIDYIKNVSSDEFVSDYNDALENLDDITKTIMKLSFDNNGYRGLTNREIADYLGIDIRKISNIRKKAMKILRKNEKIKTYL